MNDVNNVVLNELIGKLTSIVSSINATVPNGPDVFVDERSDKEPQLNFSASLQGCQIVSDSDEDIVTIPKTFYARACH